MLATSMRVRLGSAAAVMSAIAIAGGGLGCESILGLTPGKGLCAGVLCPAKDACHLPGTCDESTGQCSNPVAMDNKPCDDGNACTLDDTCQNGECIPGSPETCSTPDACKIMGTCKPKSGCSYILRDDGTLCDDGSECTTGDACKSGKCLGTLLQDGSLCGFGDSCTTLGKCMKGVCAGSKIAADSTACDDGDVCSSKDTCTKGICSPGTDRSWAIWDLTPSPSPRYDATASVVYDHLTHLTWQRTALSTTFTWDGAVDHCKTLKLAGYAENWRLPTRIELTSLLDYTQQDLAIDTIFKDAPSGETHFWTSSKVVGKPGFVWTVGFNFGYVGRVDTSTKPYRVRCVR